MSYKMRGIFGLGVIKILTLAVVMICFIVGLNNFLNDAREDDASDVKECRPVEMEGLAQINYTVCKKSPLVAGKFNNYEILIDNYSCEKLTGIPVLYIPGSTDGFNSAKFLAQTIKRLASKAWHEIHFDFFVVDLNREPNLLSGSNLLKNSEFVSYSIRKILSLYEHKDLQKKKRPNSVFLVGDSIGGMIARGVFTFKEFELGTVQAIATYGTPHVAPPLALDSHMNQYFALVNDYWSKQNLKEVYLLSVTSSADLWVTDKLSMVDRNISPEYSLSIYTSTIPRLWAHVKSGNYMKCRKLMNGLVRSLVDSIDKKTLQINNDTNSIKLAFQFHHKKNSGSFYMNHDQKLMLPLNPETRMERRDRRSWKYVRDKVPEERYSVMVISKKMASQYSFIAITNIESLEWVGACTIKPKETRCEQIGNFAIYANILPFGKNPLKIIHIDGDRLDMFTHWVTKIPKSEKKTIMLMEMYNVTKRSYRHNVTLLPDLISSKFWRKLTKPEVIISSTKPKLLFYNISLIGLDYPLQSYHVHVRQLSCVSKNRSDFETAIMKFVVPWSHGGEDAIFTIKPGRSGKMRIRLATPKPEDYEGHAMLHLYSMPLCSYRVAISVDLPGIFGQYVRIFALYLPAYLLVQVLMALSWQLIMLDENAIAPDFVNSQIHWAKPYRVGVVALAFRFVLGYGEEEGFGSKIGLPLDDTSQMERMGVWYSAMPLINYTIAYVVVLIAGLLVDSAFKTIAICFSANIVKLSKKIPSCLEYTAYVITFLISFFYNDSLSTTLCFIIYALKTIGNCAKLKQESTAENLSSYNVSVSFSFMLFFSAFLRLPQAYSLQTWSGFWTNFDPLKMGGMITSMSLCIFKYSSFPIYRSEWVGITGFVSYVCSILMLLYASFSLHRLAPFCDVVMAVVAMTTNLVAWQRKRKLFKEARAALEAEAAGDNAAERDDDVDADGDPKKDN